MKIKTQLTLAAVIAAGMLASGCSQMGAQQVSAEPAAPVAPAEVKTVVDCSSCNKPAGAPAMQGGTHTHPAIPGCTNSTTHTHKFTDPNHQHSYSCKKGPARQRLVTPPTPRLVRPPVRVAPAPKVHTRPVVTKRPQQVRQPVVAPAVDRWTHSHPAIPGCTNSITHSHPYTDPNHKHRYSCRQGQRQQPVSQYRPPAMPAVPVMPKVKAKGTYRGPIQIDGGVMQQYQQ